jgi:hypothetical protein
MIIRTIAIIAIGLSAHICLIAALKESPFMLAKSTSRGYNTYIEIKRTKRS